MKRTFFRLLLCQVLLVISASSSLAADWYVDGSAPAGGNGSQATPFNTIQLGINRAAGGDRVLVGGGVYVEALTISGKSITVSALDATLPPTIQGHLSLTGTSTSQNSSTLISLVITAGPPIFGSTQGGGVYCYDSSPTFTGCTIRDHAANDGGGVFIYQSINGPAVAPRFDECVLDNNLAAGNGGAVYVGAEAGGIGNPDVLFCNCQITSNAANNGGGVYLNDNTSAALYCSNLQNNSATISGGGLFAQHGEHVYMDGCLVRNNSYGAAGFGGGMCLIDIVHPTATNSVFYRNRSGHLGGGIYAQYIDAGQTMVLNNCLFSTNAADDGGGIYLNSESADIRFCTFSANFAMSTGGGICDSTSSGQTLNIGDSILWNDTAGLVAVGSEWTQEITINGTYNSPIVVYSDIQHQSLVTCPWGAGIGDIDQNPVFATGLYSCSLTPPGVTKFFLTQASSPCVNTGDPGIPAPPGSTEPAAGSLDVGTPDMGYHYPFTNCPCNCP